jgi:hypothetical protein
MSWNNSNSNYKNFRNKRNFSHALRIGKLLIPDSGEPRRQPESGISNQQLKLNYFFPFRAARSFFQLSRSVRTMVRMRSFASGTKLRVRPSRVACHK